MTKLYFLAAIGGLAVMTAPAAAMASTPASVRVAHADLNLASPQGVQAFDARIARAIETVCPRPDAINLHLFTLREKCARAARASVQPQRDQVIAAHRTAAGVDVAGGR